MQVDEISLPFDGLPVILAREVDFYTKFDRRELLWCVQPEIDAVDVFRFSELGQCPVMFPLLQVKLTERHMPFRESDCIGALLQAQRFDAVDVGTNGLCRIAKKV